MQFLVAISAAVIALSGCSGAGAGRPPSDYDRALRARAEGRLGDAEGLARPLADRGELRAQLLWAEILMLRGRHRHAARLLAPILRAHPDHEQTVGLAARAADGAGDAKGAIALYAHRLELVPNDREAAARLAELLLARGDAHNAYRVAHAALRMAPESIRLLVLASRAALARGMLAPALEAAHQATERASRQAAGWLQLARVQIVRGERGLAAEAYQRCLALDGQHSAALLGLGRLWLTMGRPNRAATVLERAVRVTPDDLRAWNALAAAHRRRGHLRLALAAIDKALALAPRNPRVQRNLLGLLLEVGAFERIDALLPAVADTLAARGVRPNDRRLLLRSLLRAVVARSIVAELCAGRKDSVRIAEAIHQRLTPYGLAPSTAEVTALAARVAGVVRAELRRCRRHPRPSAPGSSP